MSYTEIMHVDVLIEVFTLHYYVKHNTTNICDAKQENFVLLKKLFILKTT